MRAKENYFEGVGTVLRGDDFPRCISAFLRFGRRPLRCESAPPRSSLEIVAAASVVQGLRSLLPGLLCLFDGEECSSAWGIGLPFSFSS